MTATYKKHVKNIVGTPISQLTKNKKWAKQFLHILKDSNNQLKSITKNLNDFLNKKRVAHPRLHFMSNDEMVQLLSKQQEVEEVQKFIGNLFENVGSLELTESKTEIIGVRSREKEVLIFVDGNNNQKLIQIGPNATDGIDGWLKDINTCMRETLVKMIDDGFNELLKIDGDDRDAKSDFYKHKLS